MNFVEDPHRYLRYIYIADVVDPWPVTSKMPFGRNVRTVGESGSIAAEVEAALLENGVQHGLFSPEMMEPVRRMLGIDGIDGVTRQVDWNIPEEEIKRRVDLRSRRIFTIDPPTAKDLDDAVHIEPLGDDVYSVG